MDDDEPFPLLAAVIAGNLNEVRRLVEQVADVDARDARMSTPLMYAIEGGHLEIVEFLIANEANINTQNNVGSTPLHCAAIYSRLDIAQLLMQHGADINIPDEDGESPLFQIVGCINMFPFLAQQPGADITAIANNGSSLLHKAAWSGSIEVVTWLLQHGADTELCNEDGETPLQKIGTYNRGNRAPIIALLKQHRRFRNLAVHDTRELLLNIGLYSVERRAILTFFTSESNASNTDADAIDIAAVRKEFAAYFAALSPPENSTGVTSTATSSNKRKRS
jgi:ankyrin repeat protein